MSITVNQNQLKTIEAISLNNGSLRTVHSVWYNANGVLKRVYPDPTICNGNGLGLMTNRGTYVANTRTSRWQPQSWPSQSTSATQVLMSTENSLDSDSGLVDCGGAAYSTGIAVDLTDFSTITVNATLKVTTGTDRQYQFMSVSLSGTKPNITSNTSTYGFPGWGSQIMSFNASRSASMGAGYGNNGTAQTKSANISSYSGTYYIIVDSYVGDERYAGQGTSLVNSITLS